MTALLDTLNTLPVEARTALFLFVGLLTMGPLAISLGTLAGNACSPVADDLARFAEAAAEHRLLNKESV